MKSIMTIIVCLVLTGCETLNESDNIIATSQQQTLKKGDKVLVRPHCFTYIRKNNQMITSYSFADRVHFEAKCIEEYECEKSNYWLIKTEGDGYYIVRADSLLLNNSED